jgi:Ion transport protein
MNVKKFIHMILLCLNLIFQTMTLLVMIFHIYALAGMTIFNIDYEDYYPSTKYQTSITSFTSYDKAMITMLLIVTENGWSNIIYDYADKFDSIFKSAMFFNSFYLLVKFIILSLLTGLVWEIFTIISSNIGKKQIDQLALANEKQEGSFNSDNSINKDAISIGADVDPARLMNIKDDNLLFFRKKLNDTKKDNLKINEVSMVRDDYSYKQEGKSIIDSESVSKTNAEYYLYNIVKRDTWQACEPIIIYQSTI